MNTQFKSWVRLQCLCLIIDWLYFPSDVYIIGTLLKQPESRNVEYKLGRGQYRRDHLPDDVGRYGSAFLNSSGGTLCIGIYDDGESHHFPDKITPGWHKCSGLIVLPFQVPGRVTLGGLAPTHTPLVTYSSITQCGFRRDRLVLFKLDMFLLIAMQRCVCLVL